MVDEHPPLGQERRRQAVREPGAQGLGVGAIPLDGRAERRHPGLGLVGPDHRPPDGRVGRQHRLGLLRLHPLAADLHLVVDAAEELNRAVRPSRGQVAGVVEPGAAGVGERVRQEPLGGQCGPSDVAVSDLQPADEQPTRDTERDLGPVGIEQVDPGVPERVANRDGVRNRCAPATTRTR